MGLNKKLREQVYNKFDGKCGYCGERIKYKEMQVDHIIPQVDFIKHVNTQYKVPKSLKHLTSEDKHNYDNLMPSCRYCNKWKSSFTVDYFRQEIYEQINRLNAYSANYRMAKRYGLLEETLSPIIFYFERLQQ